MYIPSLEERNQFAIDVTLTDIAHLRRDKKAAKTKARIDRFLFKYSNFMVSPFFRYITKHLPKI